MRKYILFLIIVLFTFNGVDALTYGGCDYSVISRLKSLVTNVNITYDYTMENNYPSFNVTITNITPDMYFYDTVMRRNYYYGDTNNGEITIYGYTGTSGNLKFYSNVGECYGVSLGTKYYKFPKFNSYYNSDLCQGMWDYSICQKWADINYSYTEFKDKIEEYKNSDEEQEEVVIEYQKGFFDKLIEFYINYYYIILGLIIIVFGTIIFINSRKNRFNL